MRAKYSIIKKPGMVEKQIQIGHRILVSSNIGWPVSTPAAFLREGESVIVQCGSH